MMASIPNMRSTPLPLPGSKTAPGGETVPGDFAAQMPAVPGLPGLPVEAQPVLSEVVVGPIAPSLPSPETLDTGDTAENGDAPEKKAETPETDQPAPAALVIPFLPVQPVVPGPQVPATVSVDEASPAQSQKGAAMAPAGKSVPAAPDAGKTDLPLPAVANAPKEEPDAPKDPADAADIEEAVKALLQRKAPTKQVAAAPRGQHSEAAKPDSAPAQAQTQPQTQPTAPVAIQAPTLAAASDQPQPVPILPAPQPAPLKAEAATGTVDGTRTTDPAVERRLDLARDNQWLDRLARDIARAGSDDQPLRFRLHPQTLGSLHVELQQGDHGTVVRLTVETEAARQILADAQPRLAAEARAQGVRIAETHVDLSGSGRHAPGDQRRQDEARQTPLIRTAPGAGTDAVASARSSARARLDRYA
jgi:flagellar hook-length control protein FliK